MNCTTSRLFYFLPLFVLSFFCKAKGESVSQTEAYICLDRIIISFNTDISEEQQQLFFERSTMLDSFSKSIRLQYPPVIIARLQNSAADYSALKQTLRRLQSQPEVQFANPVLRSPEGDEVSVLQEVFVKTGSEQQAIQLKLLAAQLQFKVQETYRYNASVSILVPEKHAAINSLELAIQLADMQLFSYAHPNFLFSPVVGTNDPFFNRQWNLLNTGSTLQGSGTAGADMSVEEAWTVTQGDSSIKIAILDSGVDTLHPDLMPNLLPGYDASGGGSNGYPNKNFPKDAHGTACAGIVAAVADNGAGLSGVAPACKIIPVKVFYYVDTARGLHFDDPIPYTTSLWIANAINWANDVAHADVMSNSWGVPDFLFGLLEQPVSLVDDAIEHVYVNGRNGKGTAQLFSTGNEDDAEPLWPSRIEHAIAVTATSMCDERKSPTSCDDEDWWGGNYGAGIDVGAPGVKIPATDILGTKGFSSGSYTADFNGTSAACPNAAGVVALMLSVNPGIPASDVAYILGSSADKVGGYSYTTNGYAGAWSQELGFGRVNAYNAVQMAMNYTGTGHPATPENRFSVYPNPVSGDNFTVQFSLAENTNVSIALLDVNGRVLKTTTASFHTGQHTVSCDTPLHPGIYFLEIVAYNKTHHLKLLFSGR